MNAIRFWGIFVVGVAAGAAVALLYAPQSGADTRKQLRSNLDDATDYVQDQAGKLGDKLGDHAQRVYSRGKDAVSDAADRAAGAAQKVANIL